MTVIRNHKHRSVLRLANDGHLIFHKISIFILFYFRQCCYSFNKIYLKKGQTYLAELSQW